MWRVTKRVVKDILTEQDGVSFDITRVMWVLGTLVFFACTIDAIFIRRGTFDPIGWSTGFGAVLVAGSAGIKIKETTEQGHGPLPPPGQQ